MKNNILKLIIAFIFFTMISSQITCAHTTLQAGTIQWGELSGWGINESIHTNSSNLTYYFYSGDSNLTDAYKTIIRNGASKWSSYGTISESSSGTGKIHTYEKANTNEVAAFYDPATNSSGHLTYWALRFNRAKNFTAITAAHEFGHAYGLIDLYADNNIDKLMYGYEIRTATTPTPTDIQGFTVITGQHSYHYSWAYKAVYGFPASIPVHMRYCTTCGGYITESCTPTTGMCTICRIIH